MKKTQKNNQLKSIMQRFNKRERQEQEDNVVELAAGTEDEDPIEEDDENEMPRLFPKGFSKHISKGVIAICVVALIILGSIYFVNRTYNGYEVVEETGVKNASMLDYIPYQESLLKYSKDGATYVDEKGKAVWNETFAMKMPTADVSGDYIAIADLNGNDVYVFNKEGKVSNTSMPYKICDIEVASQGEFAVILEGESKENYINIYDKNGEPVSEIQTTIDKSGYPMDIDLSSDGTKLFSTYMYLDGVNAKNGLAAYNFGPVGVNENADRLMGGYQLESTLVPKVEFLDNNTICAFGDNQIILYTMREKPSEKAKIALKEEVQSVVFNDKYVGIVIPNNEDAKKDQNKAPFVLELYNTNGRKVMSQPIDFKYENVRMIGDEIIFTGGTECKIYTVKGKLKFSYTFSKNVVDLVPTGYSSRYIVLYDSGSEVVRLKHKSEKEQK